MLSIVSTLSTAATTEPIRLTLNVNSLNQGNP